MCALTSTLSMHFNVNHEITMDKRKEDTWQRCQWMKGKKTRGKMCDFDQTRGKGVHFNVTHEIMDKMQKRKTRGKM